MQSEGDVRAALLAENMKGWFGRPKPVYRWACQLHSFLTEVEKPGPAHTRTHFVPGGSNSTVWDGLHCCLQTVPSEQICFSRLVNKLLLLTLLTSLP